ncbi:MAG: homoserine O-acetyltransferase [Chloroflexi bacterium]|nr:homoserine O-acetyltransferase [Chloroflexota bacterium]MBV9544257.1 homoserine O-acetyltransferase [Chloroflexota bacterium]
MREVVVGVPGSAGVARTQFIDLPHPLALDSGASLEHVRIAYETYGRLAPTRDNVILVCHALSGDAHAAGWSEDPDAPSAVDGIGADERGIKPRGGLGWWDGMIGPGKAFDTDRYFVVCTNLIGSCRGSTGPSSIDAATGRPYALNFPVITVGDMVRAERGFLDVLGIERLLAVGGGSLGGMQALEWAVAYPKDVRGVISIASTARLGSQGVAWNAIARNAIMADPAWQAGDYYGTDRAPMAGIGIARMVGHVTYLSAESMHQKFGRRLQARDAYSYTLTEPDFAVESYLRHQASSFAGRFDANSYLYISRALTYFDLARDHGAGSLEAALAGALARFLLISFSSDWLYPPADSHELEQALIANGARVRHYPIQASYGHDSFLLDEARQAPLIAAFLEEISAHGDN